MKSILTEFDPDVVYSTTPTDEHADHAQTCEFVKMAISQLGKKREHREYLIHWEQHQKGWPTKSSQSQPPQGHVRPDHMVSLHDVGLKPQQKAKAISLYGTQCAIERDYLLSFAKDSEVYWMSREETSDYIKEP